MTGGLNNDIGGSDHVYTSEFYKVAESDRLFSNSHCHMRVKEVQFCCVFKMLTL